MRSSKKLRVFSGPNGSGKSTIYEEAKKHFKSIPFINADEIEQSLQKVGFIDLASFDIKINKRTFFNFLKVHSTKSIIKKANVEKKPFDFSFINNCLLIDKNKINSYAASFCASFIRWILIRKKVSFSFETVMSHPSKIEELKFAKENNYKVYLYFICTEQSIINIERVKNRVQKGGHYVGDDKVDSRYFKTLSILYPALEHCHRAYFFDNSYIEPVLIAEMYDSKLIIRTDDIPSWFVKYVITPFSKNN
jgi:predicted ABC-type ATPase